MSSEDTTSFTVRRRAGRGLAEISPSKLQRIKRLVLAKELTFKQIGHSVGETQNTIIRLVNKNPSWIDKEVGGEKATDKIYAYLKDLCKKGLPCPTNIEIGAKLNISFSTVVSSFQKLRRDGKIESRTIIITGSSFNAEKARRRIITITETGHKSGTPRKSATWFGKTPEEDKTLLQKAKTFVQSTGRYVYDASVRDSRRPPGTILVNHYNEYDAETFILFARQLGFEGHSRKPALPRRRLL